MAGNSITSSLLFLFGLTVITITFLLMGTNEPTKPQLNLQHNKLTDFYVIVKPVDDVTAMAVAIHHSVPDGVVKRVLGASNGHAALLAAGNYPVIVKTAETKVQAIDELTRFIVRSPQVQNN